MLEISNHTFCLSGFECSLGMIVLTLFIQLKLFLSISVTITMCYICTADQIKCFPYFFFLVCVCVVVIFLHRRIPHITYTQVNEMTFPSIMQPVLNFVKPKIVWPNATKTLNHFTIDTPYEESGTYAIHTHIHIPIVICSLVILSLLLLLLMVFFFSILDSLIKMIHFTECETQKRWENREKKNEI